MVRLLGGAGERLKKLLSKTPLRKLSPTLKVEMI
jgi:hypothetical protein